jgi:hypothetical protein
MANLNVQVQDGNNINVEVVATPNQTIVIDRGVQGATGLPGPNSIGGYGFSIQNLQTKDVLMFGGAAWENTPQTEITDGGNF